MVEDKESSPRVGCRGARAATLLMRRGERKWGMKESVGSKYERFSVNVFKGMGRAGREGGAAAQIIHRWE